MANKNRCQVETRVRYGDAILQNLSAKQDVSVIDDDLPISTGMIRRVVANDGNEVTIDFTGSGLTEVRYLFIESDKEISVKFNDTANTPFFISPPIDTPSGQIIDLNVRQSGVLSLHTKSLTKILISNSDTGQASLRILAAGT